MAPTFALRSMPPTPRIAALRSFTLTESEHQRALTRIHTARSGDYMRDRRYPRGDRLSELHQLGAKVAPVGSDGGAARRRVTAGTLVHGKGQLYSGDAR